MSAARKTAAGPQADHVRLAFDHAAEGLVVLDEGNRIVALNLAAAALLGGSTAELVGRSWCDACGGEHPCPRCFAREVLAAGRTLHDAQVTVPLPGGQRRALLVSAAPVIADDGLVRGAVYVLHDARAAARLNQRLAQEAVTDPLTGLANRRQLDRVLETEAARSRRHRRPLALLMIDVDHFKAYNDRHGHAAGDEVLRALGQLLRADSREEDVAARYGGEEFCVVLPETDAAAAVAKGERLRREAAAWPFTGAPVTISVGVAAAAGLDQQDLLHLADQALYAAKAGGRNQVRLAEGSAPAAPGAGARGSPGA